MPQPLDLKYYTGYYEYQQWVKYALAYGICLTDCHYYNKWRAAYTALYKSKPEIEHSYEEWDKNISECVVYNDWKKEMKKCGKNCHDVTYSCSSDSDSY